MTQDLPDEMSTVHGHEKPVDAALPVVRRRRDGCRRNPEARLAGISFLSKSGRPKYATSFRAVRASLTPRQECICQRRSETMHRKISEGTRFASLLNTKGPADRRAVAGRLRSKVACRFPTQSTPHTRAWLTNQFPGEVW